MKIKPRRIVALVALVALTGCSSPTSIEARNIAEPLRDVSARHDAYTAADESLSESERARNLRDTELLNAILDQALEGE
jgi:uncharacterized protein YcfL